MKNDDPKEFKKMAANQENLEDIIASYPADVFTLTRLYVEGVACTSLNLSSQIDPNVPAAPQVSQLIHGIFENFEQVILGKIKEMGGSAARDYEEGGAMEYLIGNPELAKNMKINFAVDMDTLAVLITGLSTLDGFCLHHAKQVMAIHRETLNDDGSNLGDAL